MRYLLCCLTILLLLTGCTMHPPSTAAFMDATERGITAGETRKNMSLRGEFSQYEIKDDGWDVPVAFELLSSSNGYTWGAGLSPSPYFIFGYGTKFFGMRGWISAPWAIGTLGVLCPTCLLDEEEEDEDDEDYDKNDRYDIGISDIGDLPGLWLVTFAGGMSIIQQLPIGDYLRIGIEEFIARNVWIPVRDNNEWSSAETGLTVYTSISMYRWSLALEGRYSILDFDTDRTRWGVSFTVTYYFSPETQTNF